MNGAVKPVCILVRMFHCTTKWRDYRRMYYLYTNAENFFHFLLIDLKCLRSNIMDDLLVDKLYTAVEVPRMPPLNPS